MQENWTIGGEPFSVDVGSVSRIQVAEFNAICRKTNLAMTTADRGRMKAYLTFRWVTAKRQCVSISQHEITAGEFSAHTAKQKADFRLWRRFLSEIGKGGARILLAPILSVGRVDG